MACQNSSGALFYMPLAFHGGLIICVPDARMTDIPRVYRPKFWCRADRVTQWRFIEFFL